MTKVWSAGAARRRSRVAAAPLPRPGSLASVSRYYAIGELGRVRVSGFVAWLLWLTVHLTFLTGFKNRVSALFHWVVSFLGRSRAERPITAQQVFARQLMEASADPGSAAPILREPIGTPRG